jgi:hypothetical protein
VYPNNCTALIKREMQRVLLQSGNNKNSNGSMKISPNDFLLGYNKDAVTHIRGIGHERQISMYYICQKNCSGC